MAIYFISDLHLGQVGRLSSEARELVFLRWLEHISPDADALYIMGDLFDFWFDYKTVVPKGFVRTLGALARLRDAGLPIFFFVGNHDMWVGKYFEQELGIPTYENPITRTLQGKSFFLGHGDGLGPGDTSYKLLKKFFRSPFCQWLFHRLHPNFGMGIANTWSNSSRHRKPAPDFFLGEKQEWLLQFCDQTSKNQPELDYFIFGHRHLPIQYTLANSKSQYVNIGDWLHHQSYGRLENGQLEVLFYEYETPLYAGQLSAQTP